MIYNYRHHLARQWDPALPLAVWVCLNPSTADANVDDPTTRKIRGFSERWGYGNYILVNLYPLRATKPADLIAAPRGLRLGLIGAADRHIADAYRLAADRRGAIFFAWGANGGHHTIRERRAEVLALPRFGLKAYCLGTTKHGEPRHPLYLRYDTPRVVVTAGIA
tara:strand:- start:2356 stop:2850 length:495 start_codon:yes stop_codon:yes gene_type:complete